MGLCRLYGIIFVFICTLDLLFLREHIKEDRILYCSFIVFIGDFLSLCFWSNQIIIAIIRYQKSNDWYANKANILGSALLSTQQKLITIYQEFKPPSFSSQNSWGE